MHNGHAPPLVNGGYAGGWLDRLAQLQGDDVSREFQSRQRQSGARLLKDDLWSELAFEGLPSAFLGG